MIELEIVYYRMDKMAKPRTGTEERQIWKERSDCEKVLVILTYIDCGNAFEFAVVVDESWTITAKDLLNSCASEFHGRNHYGWLIVLSTLCPSTTIVVGVTSLELAHLLKSIVILTATALGFRV